MGRGEERNMSQNGGGEKVHEARGVIKFEQNPVHASPAHQSKHSPCKIGLKGSSLQISILALVHLGTSTTTER